MSHPHTDPEHAVTPEGDTIEVWTVNRGGVIVKLYKIRDPEGTLHYAIGLGSGCESARLCRAVIGDPHLCREFSRISRDAPPVVTAGHGSCCTSCNVGMPCESGCHHENDLVAGYGRTRGHGRVGSCGNDH